MTTTERSVEEIVEEIIDSLVADVTYEKTWPSHTAYYQIDLNSFQKKLRQTLQAERQKRDEIVEMLDELELSCVDGRLLGKSDEYLEGYNTSTERWREKRDKILQALTQPNNPK